MSTVIQYVRKLLYEHDCVVIPELGGFLAHFNSAFYSEQNGLYHAPQKRVAFNEALKLDDGLLIHYLTLNEQISREEAQNKLRQFVETIKSSVKEKGEYCLEEIGTLSANDEGKLVFVPQPLVNFYAEGYGLSSVEVQPAQANLKIAEPDSTADWTYRDREAEELSLVALRRRRSRAGWYVGAALLAGALVLGSSISLPSARSESSLNPFALVANLSSVLKSNIDKQTVEIAEKQIVTVQSSANKLILATGEVKLVSQPLPQTVEAKMPVAVVPAPKEVAAVPKKEITETTKIISKQSDEKADYWVIAGAFSKIENAQRLAAKLQRNGYAQAYVVNPEPAEGKLIMVAAVGYASRPKAVLMLTKVTRLSGSRAWVLEGE